MDLEPVALDDLADDYGVQVPFVEYLDDLFFLTLAGDDQHSLLRLRQQHLIRRHARFTLRDECQVDLKAGTGTGGHLDRRRCQAGGAHVLNAFDRTAAHRFETGFEQELFEKRVANLNGRAFFQSFVIKLGRCHRRSVDAVAARFCTRVENRIANAGSFAEEYLIFFDDAESEGVYQRIEAVRFVKNNLTADSRHAETVAVMTDSGDAALEDRFVAIVNKG